MTTLNQKVALVTGASRGIGRAIAERLAQDGFTLALNYAGNVAKAEETAKAIEAAGGKAFAIQGDISQPADVARVFDAAQALGVLEVVVNSAGVMGMAKIDEDNLEAFDQMIATNLRGTYLVLAQAAKRLRQGGRIIALSSTVIAKAFPHYGPYIASKAGVEGLVHVLANELRGRDITVNAVAPGPVETELFMQGKSEETVAQIANMSPLQRIGQPDEIAAAVAFLAGPDGRWVNSQVLRVNGGMA